MTLKQTYKAYLSLDNMLTIQLSPTDFVYRFQGDKSIRWTAFIERMSTLRVPYFDALKFCVKHFPCRTKADDLWHDGYLKNEGIERSPLSDGGESGWNRCRNVR